MLPLVLLPSPPTRFGASPGVSSLSGQKLLSTPLCDAPSTHSSSFLRHGAQLSGASRDPPAHRPWSALACASLLSTTFFLPELPKQIDPASTICVSHRGAPRTTLSHSHVAVADFIPPYTVAQYHQAPRNRRNRLRLTQYESSVACAGFFGG